jgi:hypothetical protein
VLQDKQVASLDVEDDFFEPDAALRSELRAQILMLSGIGSPDELSALGILSVVDLLVGN